MKFKVRRANLVPYAIEYVDAEINFPHYQENSGTFERYDFSDGKMRMTQVSNNGDTMRIDIPCVVIGIGNPSTGEKFEEAFTKAIANAELLAMRMERETLIEMAKEAE